MKPSVIAKTFVVVAAVLIVLTLPVLAGEVTIIGQINDNYQLVTDGQIYEIADTVMGNDLAENYISAKVQVTGTVEETDDVKVISVASYKVMSD